MIADGSPQLKRLVELAGEEIRQLWQGLEEMESADALEAAVQQSVRSLGKSLMQALSQEAVQRREQRETPSCCGEMMDHHSRRWRTGVTLVGTVRIRRRYYRCLRCGRSLFPADGWLGWRGDFSLRVEEVMAWEASLLPYRQAVASLSKLAGLDLSLKGAEQIVARWGEEELTPDPYEERVTADLVVQIDGTKAHLEDGWREIKVGACFDWDRTDPQREPEAVSCVADWESAQDFAETLWEEALARGAPGARAQAVIGDGAPWIWELASLLFPKATQILDWYHLTEHLWEAAEVVSGEGSEATKALERVWETEIWEGRSEMVEGRLRELLAAGEDDRNNTLRRCADYLQTHQARLRYHLFRAAGWPVGSGVVEGACKHVVGLRFKRQSTRWTKPGARAVLHLRLDRLNNRWETRVNHLRQQLPKAA